MQPINVQTSLEGFEVAWKNNIHVEARALILAQYAKTAEFTARFNKTVAILANEREKALNAAAGGPEPIPGPIIPFPSESKKPVKGEKGEKRAQA